MSGTPITAPIVDFAVRPAKRGVRLSSGKPGGPSMPNNVLSLSASRREFSRAANASSTFVPQHLQAYYDRLYADFGPQSWWPARSRFEVIVGAILVQNTSWSNVTRATANLRKARALSPSGVRDLSTHQLEKLLRPAGYFRQKTRTVRTFIDFLYKNHGGSLRRLFALPTDSLRAKLLALRGIGPETADSILLYAGKHPVFVVDAYTRRIMQRHGLTHPKTDYEDLRAIFESSLPREHQLFNEFHALIVRTGKLHCRKSNPDCPHCPLNSFLPPVAGHGSPVASS
jgi:endonuclease-3 related protein